MKDKERYFAPETYISEMKYEGIICISGGPLSNPIDAPGFSDGGELI